MLGTLETYQKQDWKKYISSLVFFYNSTPHETTRISPYELMYGRKPKLPIDIRFEEAIEGSGNKAADEYVAELRDRMENTKKIVEKYAEKAKSKQKKQYNKKAKSARIHVGDKVLVKKVAFDGKHKIADKFEEETYRVLEQKRPDIPVFRIKSESGIEKILHRNLLLKIEEDDEEIDDREDDIHDASKEMSDVRRNGETDGDGVGAVIGTDQDGDAHLPETSCSERKENIENGRAFKGNDKRTEETAVEVTGDDVDDDDPNAIWVDHWMKNDDVVASVEDAKKIEEGSKELVVTEEQKEVTENKKTETVVVQEPPKPVPRKSTRIKKPPDRYGNPVAHCLVRPINTKVQALDALLNSGVLNDMDNDTVNKLLSAVIQ